MTVAGEPNETAACEKCGSPATCMRLSGTDSHDPDFPDWDWRCSACCGHMSGPEDHPCIPAQDVPAFYSQVDRTAVLNVARYEEAIRVLKRETGIDLSPTIELTVSFGYKTVTCSPCNGKGRTSRLLGLSSRTCVLCQGVGCHFVSA